MSDELSELDHVGESEEAEDALSEDEHDGSVNWRAV
jgi:hypothetical protein